MRLALKKHLLYSIYFTELKYHFQTDFSQKSTSIKPQETREPSLCLPASCETPVPVQQTASQPIPTPTFSVADEILKFKQLLDMGAITQEEYDTKKAELLSKN